MNPIRVGFLGLLGLGIACNYSIIKGCAPTGKNTINACSKLALSCVVQR